MRHALVGLSAASACASGRGTGAAGLAQPPAQRPDHAGRHAPGRRARHRATGRPAGSRPGAPRRREARGRRAPTCWLSAPNDDAQRKRTSGQMRALIRRIVRSSGSWSETRSGMLATCRPWFATTSVAGRIGLPPLTRSRSSLPGLKCGTCLPGRATESPVFGIAAQARRAVMQRKAAEAADLDALAVGQRTAHHFEQRLDRQVDVVGLQVGLATRAGSR